MQKTLVYQQSRQYEQFQCSGANCEDSCCSGWQVTVDRGTYEKYQKCSHPVLRPRLDQWVQIQPAAKTAASFARIVLTESQCPFLAEKLCSIQSELGEDHLGKTCATFPRIRNQVAGVIERSLDFSCPEAARLCLTDPAPATFHQTNAESDDMDAAENAQSVKPYFWEIRSAMLSVLQKRRFPVTKRLLLIGYICGKLDELAGGGDESGIPRALEGFGTAIDGGLFDAHLEACSANAADQLTTVLELMVARIKLDFTPQRYREQYQELVDGLQLKPGLNIRDCAGRYVEAYRQHYLPFMTTHEHMLEHYLVHYAYRTLFPFGTQGHDDIADAEWQGGAFTRQYMLVASYFASIRAMMIGLAARHGAGFGVDHAVRCIQGSARTLEHCTSYPSQILRILMAKGVIEAGGMSVLTQDPRA